MNIFLTLVFIVYYGFFYYLSKTSEWFINTFVPKDSEILTSAFFAMLTTAVSFIVVIAFNVLFPIAIIIIICLVITRLINIEIKKRK